MTCTVISRWFIKGGCAGAARAALAALSDAVRKGEPGTLVYLSHESTGVSLPVAAEGEVTFFEVYADDAAFTEHVSGQIFTGFLKSHGDLFLQNFPPNSGPFMTVSRLDRKTGFIREDAC